jgi:hypothetical protein
MTPHDKIEIAGSLVTLGLLALAVFLCLAL